MIIFQIDLNAVSSRTQKQFATFYLRINITTTIFHRFQLFPLLLKPKQVLLTQLCIAFQTFHTLKTDIIHQFFTNVVTLGLSVAALFERVMIDFFLRRVIIQEQYFLPQGRLALCYFIFDGRQVHFVYRISFISININNLNFLSNSALQQLVAMKGNLSSKLQGFRKQIRREQIQTYKKNKRKELLQESSNSSGINETYWGVLRYHQLQKLRQMSSQTLRCHMQMLEQVIFQQDNRMFVDAFEKIMIILVDFYEEASSKWRDQAKRYLSYIDIDQYFAQDCIDVYVLTQVFSFIPANSFIKILGGIYHDINPLKNYAYLHKVILLLRDILNFTFMDYERVKYLLQFFDNELDWRLNKTINRNFIFNVFMNISYSEDHEIGKMITDQNIFGRIQESIEVYGLSQKQNLTLSQCYSNCIEYLCSKVTSLSHQYLIQQPMQDIQIYLYIPIFEHLISLDDSEIIQHLIYSATCLLQTSFECDLHCKEQIMDTVFNIARKIIQNKVYYQSSERIFIMLAKYADFSDSGHHWLIDLLDIILKDHSSVYFGKELRDNKTKQNRESLSKGKILRNIKDLLAACQLILSRCDPNNIFIQQFLVKCIFQFWYKEEIIKGSQQLIAFFQTAIEHSKQLSNFIIFQEYAQHFVTFLGGDYELLQEKHAIIRLIKSTCYRIDESDMAQVQAYLAYYAREWNNISARLQDYCSNQDIIQGQYCHQANYVNERVCQMIKGSYIQ